MSWSEGPGRRKKKVLSVDETAGTSQGCPLESNKGQETTTAVSAAGHTISIKHVNQGDKSIQTKKMDDESEQGKEIDVKEQGGVNVKECEKITNKSGDESTNDDEPEVEPLMVEFEDPMYELSQTYEMEPKYESMTMEQEAAKVQALSPTEQAKYRELTRLHK